MFRSAALKSGSISEADLRNAHSSDPGGAHAHMQLLMDVSVSSRAFREYVLCSAGSTNAALMPPFLPLLPRDDSHIFLTFFFPRTTLASVNPVWLWCLLLLPPPPPPAGGWCHQGA